MLLFHSTPSTPFPQPHSQQTASIGNSKDSRSRRSPSPVEGTPSSKTSSLAYSQNDHSFLQSPTHARSNSGSTILSSSSHNRPQQQHVSKDALLPGPVVANKNTTNNSNNHNTALAHFLNPSATFFSSSISSGSLPEAENMETEEGGNIMSFASGYSLYQQQKQQLQTPAATAAATVIAKPLAIYPQDQPCRKRYSPRHSTPGVIGGSSCGSGGGGGSSSYLLYSSALAATIEQHQLQQHLVSDPTLFFPIRT
ncbi:MAG: hypothetical protein J3R72DRAFT_420245 [Linnemannia gamsii]|nr:MAG: hypothetical protein J3R72DRAFT_420245 [Linnemannia gamsii]